MGKKLMKMTIERDNIQQKWGFSLQGGQEMTLTLKVASVKKFTPASIAGLEKMDYVYTVNGKEVFQLTQEEVAKEIQNSGKQIVLEVERGEFIVPSFAEIWPELGKKKEDEGRGKTRPMSMEYILEAMQHHGLGHMPQPDNFTTCGKLGIEINQYNNPMECYADGTIEDMREEKVIMDFPDIADKLIEMNTQKHKDLNPACAQKMKRFDPGRSAVLSSLVEVEKQAKASKENAGSAGV